MSHVVKEGATSAAAATHHNPDMRAAYMGLIVGAVALLIIVWGIVKLTSASFDDHAAAPGAPAPAATTPH